MFDNVNLDDNIWTDKFKLNTTNKTIYVATLSQLHHKTGYHASGAQVFLSGGLMLF